MPKHHPNQETEIINTQEKGGCEFPTFWGEMHVVKKTSSMHCMTSVWPPGTRSSSWRKGHHHPTSSKPEAAQLCQEFLADPAVIAPMCRACCQAPWPTLLASSLGMRHRHGASRTVVEDCLLHRQSLHSRALASWGSL